MVDYRQGQNIFPFSTVSDSSLGHIHVISSGLQGLFPCFLDLTTDLHVVSSLRMCEAIPQLLLIKHRGNFTFTLTHKGKLDDGAL